MTTIHRIIDRASESGSDSYTFWACAGLKQLMELAGLACAQAREMLSCQRVSKGIGLL
jgi:hypothetical protein